MSRLWDMCKRSAGKAGALFLVLAVVAVTIHYLPDFDEDALALYVRDKGAFGVAVYVAVAAIGSAFGIPRQGLSFVAGYAFGTFFGVTYATLGTTLGCAVSFFITRRLGRPFLPERFALRMKRFDDIVSAAPFSMTLTVRCMPFGNNALTNVLAGMSSIPAFGFIGGSFIGYIPQNFIFSLLGSGMRVDPFWRVLAAAVLFIAALGIGIFLFRRHKASFIEGSENSIGVN
jgi:uncharacterized membrane protein YdjX (TVP38/TMEM64 family)